MASSLGHPSFGYLKRPFPFLFWSCDESSFKCETCILAKSHCTVFRLSDNKAAKSFDLVHSDVWGPAHVTSNEFCTIVSTQFHARVKVFRTDNGGKYVNNTLACFFCTQGIIDQTTTPFTPQENVVSERKNRQLLEVFCSLILDMSVPHHRSFHFTTFILGNGVGPLQAVEAGDGDWSAVLAGAVDRWWLAGSGGRWWLVGVVAKYGHVA
ncbi:unnamed protein product [Prunus armeniaca]